MQLAAIFTDHMVLQRNKPIAVFGDGAGRGRIELDGAVVEFEATDGFLVHLPPMEAGGPHEMTVTLDGETTVLTDILIGDVYLAGGQSNMQFKLHESSYAPDLWETEHLLRLYSADRRDVKALREGRRAADRGCLAVSRRP